MRWWVVALAQFVVAFTLAARASAAIQITFVSPAPGKPPIVGTVLEVRVMVSSPFEIKMVSAKLSTLEVALTTSDKLPPSPDPDVRSWTGMVAAVYAPHGPTSVVVTATDMFGDKAQASADVIHDESPSITITSPVYGALVRPDVRIFAT